jgi:folylpolyglutamate synthase/dihydropteroate synthase
MAITPLTPDQESVLKRSIEKEAASKKSVVRQKIEAVVEKTETQAKPEALEASVDQAEVQQDQPQAEQTDTEGTSFRSLKKRK